MRVRLVNLARYVPHAGEKLFKVDRSTPLGNPFMVGGTMSHLARQQACVQYDEYFRQMVAGPTTDIVLVGNAYLRVSRTAFMDYLNQIAEAGKTSRIALGCWCVPKRCHAEIILQYLREGGEWRHVNSD